MFVKGWAQIYPLRFLVLDDKRIGHMLMMAGYYFKCRDAGRHNPKVLDILVASSAPANETFADLIGRHAKLIRSNIFKSFCTDATLIWPNNKHISRMKCVLYDRGVYPHTEPLYHFSKQAVQKGEALIEEMGIPKDGKIICFFARDQAYLNHVDKTRNWDYHSFRNGSFKDYQKMAEHFAEQGYWLLRVGAYVAEKIDMGHPRIIDYSSKYRSDFGDAFLGMKSSWFIGDMSGITDIYKSMGTGGVCCNIGMGDLYLTWKNFISVPMLYQDLSDGKLLSYKESISRNLHLVYRTEVLRDRGVQVICPTSEIMIDALQEKIQKDTGTWSEAPGDAELEQAFWSLYPKDFMGWGTRDPQEMSPLSILFLRRYSHLVLN
jgi:putative glycosyltransferase (TIGR04372 family)